MKPIANEERASNEETYSVPRAMLDEYLTASYIVAFDEDTGNINGIRFYRAQKAIHEAIGRKWSPPESDDDQVLDVESGEWLQIYCDNLCKVPVESTRYTEPARLLVPGDQTTCPVCHGVEQDV